MVLDRRVRRSCGHHTPGHADTAAVSTEAFAEAGGPGGGAGEFRLPHGIWIDRHERVLVADRENDRVQVFTQEGEYISTWPIKLIGPVLFYVDSDDTVYVSEHNGGLFSVLSLEGELITQWGSELHRSCHGVWADSNKDLYFVMPGEWGRDRRVVKFHRR